MKRIILYLIIMVVSTITIPSATAITLSPSNGVFDGCYTFTTALSSNKRLDVSGGSSNNGANIQIWEANDTDAQNFYVTKVNSNWYSIRNYSSRKAIDVAGGVSGDGVNVQLYEWNGTDAQLWNFEDAGDGYYYVRNKLGYYLDVNNWETSNGTNVLVWSCHGGNNQKWKLDSACLGFFTISSALDDTMCLDVSGAGTANGTNIQIWTSNKTKAQIFAISRLDPDWYSIRNVMSGKSIDVSGGNRDRGTNVQLYDWNATDAQKWKIRYSNDGYVFIENKLGCYLDVSGGGTSDGTNVLMWTPHKEANQKWTLKTADMTDVLNEYIIKNVKIDFSDNYLSQPYYVSDRLIMYYKKFNHGAKYDIKRESCWNNFFKDICFPGRNGVFEYSGYPITAEDLGNIIYGYAGNYLRLGDKVIFQGGGFAASGTSGLQNPPLYGDDQKDHTFIWLGIQLSGRKPIYDVDLATFSGVLDFVKNIL